MLHRLSSIQYLDPDEVQRLVSELFDRWKLDMQTRQRLLGQSKDLCVTASPNRLDAEALGRARLLLEIHAGLRMLFPEDSELRWSWIHQRHNAFNGRAPLDVLLEGHGGVIRVAEEVRSELAI